MTKAVILDITDGEATVMTKEGDIIGVKDQNYDIGQEIEIEIKTKASPAFSTRIKRFMPAMAAAVALVILLGGGSYVYLKPYGTVSLDVNPSIEYTINMFDRVLNTTGVNDDGENILSELEQKSLINKDIEEAVEETIEQIRLKGYLSDEDTNYVVVTANTEQEQHTEKLVNKLDTMVAGKEKITPIVSKVSLKDIEEAHDQGISAGKKLIIDHLENVSDKVIDRDEWKSRSVKDIVREYDRIQVNEPAPTPEENREQPDGSSIAPPEAGSVNEIPASPVNEIYSREEKPAEIPEERTNDRPQQAIPGNNDPAQVQDNRPFEAGRQENNWGPGNNSPQQDRGGPGSSR